VARSIVESKNMGSSSRPASGTRRVKLLYGRKVSLFSFLVALPGFLITGTLIWVQPWSMQSKLGLLALELFAWWLLAMALQEHATRPLQTLANVIAALREEDYSFRARNAVPEDALGELSLEVNALADMLSDQRIRAIEATALLRRVVEEIDAPLFAFDPAQRLQLVNSAGERLLQSASVRLMGGTAHDLGLDDFLSAANESLLAFPANSQARWLVRRSTFRQRGVPHTLVVLSDVSRALREEERSAWQRLVRVLGHELNNSLTPIKSIAGSLQTRMAQTNLGPEEKQDFTRGLEIIESRAASLNRFLQAYRQLAQMPPPLLRQCTLSPVVQRAAALETRLTITVIPGPEVTFVADPDQLEQMLINLVRNATEAVLEPAEPPSNLAPPQEKPAQPEVVVSWRADADEILLTVEDNGPGLLNPSNAFVPFYTTKPAGSGIGLVLSRQIVEAHGGSIELTNREDKRGCRVKIVLPLRTQ
jgi:nitrogen fixation/metabolism regulation signal transduction histidine kinase